MIICPNPHPSYPDDWMLVRQSDHDDHCGFIAAHWASPLFWQPASPRLLTVAVAMHDTGSANWEDRPTIDAAGHPYSYWTLPPDEHIQLHRLGVQVACQVHPYVALLISMHVVGIHQDRLHIDPSPNRWHMPEHDTPAVRSFIAEQLALQSRLRTQVDACFGRPLSDAALLNDFILFEVIDILSTQFAACGLADRSMTYVPDRAGAPLTLSLTRAGQWEFKLSPFPFPGDRFDCPLYARRVPIRAYPDDDHFRAAWYAAELVKLPYACVR